MRNRFGRPHVSFAVRVAGWLLVGGGVLAWVLLQVIRTGDATMLGVAFVLVAAMAAVVLFARRKEGEAPSQGRIPWPAIGVFAVTAAIPAYFAVTTRDTMIVAFGALAASFNGVVAWWVWKDAQRHGMDAVGWPILAGLFWPGLFLYVVYREKRG